ncbi:MAG: DUF763 domain-containing protein [Thermoplasmata archaeon]|nr:MAG: DUF763 domain-containing protein [Thermoplasmata archaeon]
MPKTGVANLPLHYGKAPRWLYKRMVKLADAISGIIIYEYGEEKFLELLSNPYWFQAFSCVLGYDWHSSGTTTVTTAALKQALEKYGIAVAGGKGMASKTLQEIERKAEKFEVDAERIKYASRMAAKVDTAALQDGYNLYHHAIIFTSNGKWAVVQQGMNAETRYARRYHWIWKIKDFVEEPHAAIVGKKGVALDMTAKESEEARKISVDIAKEKPNKLAKQFKILRQHQQTLEGTIVLLDMPRRINWDALKAVYEIQPRNYEEMLAIKGIGAATVRALAYVSDLIYGKPPSWKDPVKYSFAVGGKDGVPYPVNRKAMDEATHILQLSLEEAKIGEKEKLHAIKRLKEFVPD